MAIGSGFAQGANLTGVNLSGSELSYTTISGVHLDRANLDLARLNSAHLSMTSFRGASLRNADLTGAECEGADFTDANLALASLPNVGAFKNSKLLRANLEGATVDIGVLCYGQLQGATLAQMQIDAVNAWWNVHKGINKSYDAILLATNTDRLSPLKVNGVQGNLELLRQYDLRRSQHLEERLGSAKSEK